MSLMLAAALAVAPQPAAPTRCVALNADFDAAEKELAAIYADELADRSAIRAALRNQRTQIEQTRAAATVDLMRAGKCKLPAHAATHYSYLTAALACRVEIAKVAPDAPACRRATWTRNKLTD